jgi:hypothetical protein
VLRLRMISPPTCLHSVELNELSARITYFPLFFIFCVTLRSDGESRKLQINIYKRNIIISGKQNNKKHDENPDTEATSATSTTACAKNIERTNIRINFEVFLLLTLTHANCNKRFTPYYSRT